VSGTICLCGLAKSYHGEYARQYVHNRVEHEYRPRYPTVEEAWAILWEEVGSGNPDYSGIELRKMVEEAYARERTT
jgi:hypothetical protein